MGMREVSILTCDICGTESKPQDDNSEWLSWDQNHPVLDRSWISRACCPSCVDRVQIELNKRD